MKKAWFFLLAILLPGLYYVVTAQVFRFAEQDKLRKVERDKVKMLTEAGLYDSAISYCALLRKEDKLGYSELEEALANIYWYKGDKKTAYQYVLNQTDYNLRLSAGAHAFSGMLYDFDNAYPLATDSFLEHVIIDKVKDFYLKQDFPEATSGYKLILLDYQLNKCAERYQHDVKHQQDTLQVSVLTRQYNESRLELKERFLNLIRQHNKLFTWREAGSGYEAQYSFIRSAEDDDLHRQLEPYFESAFREERILPEVYVDELVLKSGWSKNAPEKVKALRDSLCAVYKCAPTTERILVTEKGDTIRYIELVKPVRTIQQ